ncbi:hypothetical protein ACWCHM_26950 [Micromonospora sp. SCSIO 07396]
MPDDDPPNLDVPPEPGFSVGRHGPTWLILGVVAVALLICCCSAVAGLGLAWSTGLFHPR